MTRRFLALIVLPLLLSSCSLAGRAPAEPLDPAMAPEPSEEVTEGSAALEEAGLSGESAGAGPDAAAGETSGGVGGEAGTVDIPALDLEEVSEALVPGAFLYPAGGELPESAQRQVEGFVHALTEGRASDRFGRWLEREAVWGDWIRGRLREAGLPEELVYLAMIESGFHPTIVSHAGATGMWQFMPATGRRSGLRVDSWVDERRDPEAATRAAIRHLAELHEATGDWALSAAAYNAGLGRVSRAQRRQPADQRDYFSLSAAERLPRETRNYVPIMLAAAWVDAHRVRYGLPAREPAAPPALDTLAVDGRVRLSVLAEGLGLPHDTLKALNAHLVRGAVPPEGGTVRVPSGTDTLGLGGFLAAVPRDRRLLPDWHETRYAVRTGDSWWRIARRHDTTVDRLRRLNPRRGDIIHPGDRLLVRRVASYDVPGRVAPAGAVPERESASERDGKAGGPVGTPARTPADRVASSTRSGGGPAAGANASTSYVVRPGDTMTGIARRHGVALADLARWNDMPAPRPVRIGETIRVTPPVVRYTVRPGDTMTGIASRYAVRVSDLAEWNGMARPRPLRAGETLVIRRP